MMGKMLGENFKSLKDEMSILFLEGGEKQGKALRSVAIINQVSMCKAQQGIQKYLQSSRKLELRKKSIKQLSERGR